MYANPKEMIGSSDASIAALRTVKFSVHAGSVTCETDCSMIDALRSDLRSKMDKEIDFRARERLLHSFQHKEYAMGAWHFTTSTNIYGWAAGDSLLSNIGGGRWAQTPRGWTLSQVIEWGCGRAQERNVRFSFPEKDLPEEVRTWMRANQER